MFSCSAPQWLPIYVKLKAKLQAALLWSAVDRVVGYPGIRCWLLLAGVSVVQSGSHDQCLLSGFCTCYILPDSCMETTWICFPHFLVVRRKWEPLA